MTETVPIYFIRRAGEIEIVDAVRDQSSRLFSDEQQKIEFGQQKLLHLRAGTLVLAADVVDQQLTKYLESHGIRKQFGAQERPRSASLRVPMRRR